MLETQKAFTKSCLAELLDLAECRQTTVSKETQKLYLRELMPYEIADVRTALRKMARTNRSQFETSYPTLGTILEQVARARYERIFGILPAQPARPVFDVPYVMCDRKHVLGHNVYVNAAGDPCEPHESPKRLLAPCKCWWEWIKLQREWESETGPLGAYRRALYGWNCQYKRTALAAGYLEVEVA